MTGIKWTRGLIVVWTAVALACASGAAIAEVDLRFAPPDTALEVAQIGRLSILLDSALEVRTLDVNVSYDPAVVRSLGGGAGTLYTDSGIFTFQGFEEDVPGQWHGYAVLMGAGFYIQGPGELYYWDFETLADGTTPIVAIDVSLSTTDGSWFQNVMLPATTVTVGDGASGITEVPTRQAGLQLWPNPFNPRMEVRFKLPQPGPVRLSVYDLRGCRVADLIHAQLPAGPHSAFWDGRLADGRAAPGGTYLFRLQGPQNCESARATLLK